MELPGLINCCKHPRLMTVTLRIKVQNSPHPETLSPLGKGDIWPVITRLISSIASLVGAHLILHVWILSITSVRKYVHGFMGGLCIKFYEVTIPIHLRMQIRSRYPCCCHPHPSTFANSRMRILTLEFLSLGLHGCNTVCETESHMSLKSPEA